MLPEGIRRNYEVSIWTLQDSFITVLKPANLEFKGQIQAPDMKIKDDGTLTLSFSIPMYLYVNGIRQENPIWYNTRNGVILADLRKLKVIFNKKKNNEKIFEFLITKVVESHEKGQLICKVESEGLAFHELGHKGLKVTFSLQDYLNDYNAWLNGLREEEPHNNLNYWCDKLFQYSDWTYEVQMDWASYDGLLLVKRPETDYPILENDYESGVINLGQIGYLTLGTTAASINSWYAINYSELTIEEKAQVDQWRQENNYRLNNRIYEDAYVSSWQLDAQTDTLIAQSTTSFQEKYRIIEISESNFYNITQTLAETFGVYCRYEYNYDADYHIIGKKVIFFNNFVQEQNGPFDITYPYQTDKISRTMDGTDICTKLYVSTVEDSSAPAGVISIATAAANKTKEDYILNFDYLYKIGTITEEQYAAVQEFEVAIRKINDQLEPLAEEIIELENELVEYEATKKIMEESVIKDREQLNQSQDLLNAITDNRGTVDLTKGNAISGILIEDFSNSSSGNVNYKIKLTTKGILCDSGHPIQVYRTLDDVETPNWIYNINNSNDNRIERDDYGNIIGLKNIPASAIENNNYRWYIILSYRPALYNENVYTAFARKLAADTSERDNATQRVNDLKQKLDGTEVPKVIGKKELYQNLIVQKTKLKEDFSNFMGPALREGQWSADTYNDYSDQYNTELSLGGNAIGLASFIWDEEAFENEASLSLTIGIDEQEESCALVILNNELLNQINTLNAWNDISFVYEDSTSENINSVFDKSFGINSTMFYVFVKNGPIVSPALLLSDISYNDLSSKTHFRLSIRTAQVNNNSNLTTAAIQIQEQKIADVNIVNAASYVIQYPRVKIDSLSAKIADDTLSLQINNERLAMYSDYSIFVRNDAYWFTPKVGKIIQEWQRTSGIVTCTIAYQISNADTAIFLDAREVSQTNAWPQVSYDVAITLLKDGLWEKLYTLIGYIINVNDDELKFENVQGYISEIELKLDTPWEDSVKIKNYKTKFEDLFSTIVASSNIVQANAAIYDKTVALFNSDGTIKQTVIQTTLNKMDLNYAFQNGELTIDKINGIWGASEDGVVAFTGGGIFTATEQDANGNWLWNTGIVPSGINASLLNAGQIDTNLIRIFAGDNLRFQMNGEGLYAFRANDDGTVNLNQYVVHNSDGLTLMAKAGEVLNNTTLTTDVERVKISWDGITIRDNTNRAVLSMDQNGNAVFAGTLSADVGNFDTILTNNLITLGAPTVRITALEGREFQESQDGTSRSPNFLSFKITPLLFTLGNNNPINISKVTINNNEEILTSLAIVTNLEEISATQVYLDINNLTFAISSDTILLGSYSQTYKIVCQSDSGDSYAEYLTLNVLRAGLQGPTGAPGAPGSAAAASYTATIISSNGDKFKSTTDWTVMYCNVYQGDEWIDGYDIDYVYYYNTNEGNNIPLGISYGNKKFAYFNDKSSRMPNFSFGQYTIDGQSWSTISSPRIGNKTFTWNSINAYGVSNGQYAVGPMIFIGPDAINTKATFTCVVSEGS